VGSRRRRSHPAAAAAAAAVVAALALVAGCGGGSDEPTPRPDPAPAPTPQRLALGVTEFNAQLTRPPSAPAAESAEVTAFRRQATTLRPRYLRLVVDWFRVGADPSAAPDLAIPQDGCLRGTPPCSPFAGIRGQLEAVREQQRAGGAAWEVVVVIAWTPEWAARAAGGCERDGTGPRARAITDEGIRGYRRLIRELVALGEEVGVPLRWWSPFNEPNHPAFVSPQREECDTGSPSRSGRLYARLVRAAQAELRAAGGERRLVLGELAGVPGPSPRATGIAEFVESLPDDIACAGDVWAQHQYIRPDGDQHDAVGELSRALDERACTRAKPMWITETGSGGAVAGKPRDTSPEGLAAQCRAMHEALVRFDEDPKVEAAFQYTLREDPGYAVGLFDPELTRAYPVYDVWRAWSRATPEDPAPPALPASCA
jgi:hypothetical protein